MKDIEVGDQITATYSGEPFKIITITKVESRRGRVRRVIGDDKQKHALRVWVDGTVQGHEFDSQHSYRRTEPGDEKAVANKTLRAKLRRRFEQARAGLDDWPIEDVQRVLDAWPEAVAK